MTDTSTELATVDRSAMHVFEPTGLEDAYRLAKILVASRLLPRSVATPEAAMTIMLTGRELGMTTMQALRSIHVVDGKPTMSADLIVALCKRSPVCRYFRLVDSTATAATYETLRDGDPEPTRMTFSLEEARAAGLAGKDNWRKYPAAMLRARCSAALARAVFPDLAMGLYDPDELSTHAVQRAPQRLAVERVEHVQHDEPQPEQDAGEPAPEPMQLPSPEVPDEREQTARQFAERLAAAQTAEDVKAIGADLSAALKRKAITRARYDELVIVGKATKERLEMVQPAPAEESEAANG